MDKRDIQRRDLAVTVIAFIALGFWVWLWVRRELVMGAADSLLLWHVGQACMNDTAACWNGLYPLGYPVLTGALFPRDAVYGPTFLNLGITTVALTTVGMTCRWVGASFGATLLAVVAFAVNPFTVYLAANPGPNAAALLCVCLAAVVFCERPQPSAARALGAGVFIGAAALWRSELLWLPVILAALGLATGGSRRTALAGLGGALLGFMPQVVLALTVQKLPWEGIHGLMMVASWHPELNWHRMHEAAIPTTWLGVIAQNPLGACAFWGQNMLQMLPWAVACALPALTRADPATDRRDRIVAIGALVWTAAAATGDRHIGTLVLATAAVVQAARVVVPVSGSPHGPRWRGVRAGAMVLFVAWIAWTTVRLRLETAAATVVEYKLVEVTGLMADSGADNAGEILAVDPTTYLPNVPPYAAMSSGSWLRLPGATVVSPLPEWCLESWECLVRDLIAHDIEFLLVDGGAIGFYPILGELALDRDSRTNPPECTRLNAWDGQHAGLIVSCAIDPVTGALVAGEITPH